MADKASGSEPRFIQIASGDGGLFALDASGRVWQWTPAQWSLAGVPGAILAAHWKALPDNRQASKEATV